MPPSPSNNGSSSVADAGEQQKIRTDLALVEDWFVYHAPTEKQQQLLKNARHYALQFAQFLVMNVKDSRERAIALTELRKAVMCANQAIIFDRSLA
jgi:hypothetical protein